MNKVRRKRSFRVAVDRRGSQEAFERDIAEGKLRMMEELMKRTLGEGEELVPGTVQFFIGGKSMEEFVENRVYLETEYEAFLEPLDAIEEDLARLRGARSLAGSDRGAFLELSCRLSRTLFTRDRLRAGEEVDVNVR